MDSETHKEIVEIKRDIRELRAGQDAEFHHGRDKYEKLLDEAIKNDKRTAKILLEIDGFQSAKEIQEKLGIPQQTCWRKFDRLLSKDIIFSSEESKNGSPIYQQSRWFKKLRLEEQVKSKYLQNNHTEEQNAATNSTTEQNQNS